MIIHRGIDVEHALPIKSAPFLTSYVDEQITVYLNEIFGHSDGSYLILSRYNRQTSDGSKYIVIYIEDKDKDYHTLYFKLIVS